MKPRVKLVGGDGNAYAILGACRRAARAAGWSDDDWARFHAEATSGSYGHLLATVMQYFDVE
jgi:hypothetical protein